MGATRSGHCAQLLMQGNLSAVHMVIQLPRFCPESVSGLVDKKRMMAGMPACYSGSTLNMTPSPNDGDEARGKLYILHNGPLLLFSLRDRPSLDNH
jgi:hypothetical protein